MVYRNVLALIVSPSSQGDADGPGSELSVEDDHHDLVRRSATLFQRLVGLVYQALKLLFNRKHKSVTFVQSVYHR